MKPYPNIMIIEDDFCISLAMSSQLKTIGCKIQGAFPTAEEAWKEIKYCPPDLVLLNFYLSGPMNGLEMIFRIRTRYDFPIIMVSGVDFKQLPNMPDVWLLPKPFLGFQLRHLVKDALGSSHLVNINFGENKSVY